MAIFVYICFHIIKNSAVKRMLLWLLLEYGGWTNSVDVTGLRAGWPRNHGFDTRPVSICTDSEAHPATSSAAYRKLFLWDWIWRLDELSGCNCATGWMAEESWFRYSARKYLYRLWGPPCHQFSSVPETFSLGLKRPKREGDLNTSI